MLAHLLDADLVEELAKTAIFFPEAALQSPRVPIERVSYFTDGGPSGRHQQSDRLLDFFRYAVLCGTHDCIDEFAGMICKRRIRSRKRAVV